LGVPENDVVGFDIAVDDAEVTDGFVAFEQLPEKLLDFFFVEPVGILSDVLCERSAFEQLHGEIAKSLLKSNLMQFDNVLNIEFGELTQRNNLTRE
jgi:hypothetical protein